MRVEQHTYWRHLNPDLSISTSSHELVEITRIDSDRLESFLKVFDREGYTHLAQVYEAVIMARLAAAVESIVQQGIPPVFAFVYDQFWVPFRQLGGVLEQILASRSLMLPNFWLWHVDPKLTQSGWRPHRDIGRESLFPNRRPKCVNAWIALTEATLLNGCIYVVPAHWDATYGTERENIFFFDHRSIRALPAKVGDAFVWNQALLHWGSRSSDLADGPRISMAMEFQCADVPPFKSPLIDPRRVISFDLRLALIARQLVQYRHMYGDLDAESSAFADNWAPRLEEFVGYQHD